MILFLLIIVLLAIIAYLTSGKVNQKTCLLYTSPRPGE